MVLNFVSCYYPEDRIQPKTRFAIDDFPALIQTMNSTKKQNRA